MTRPIYASITLTQEGNKGDITFSTAFSDNNTDDVPLAHEAMSNIVATYLQLRAFEEAAESTDDSTYTATFILEQDSNTSDVYASLKLNPKVQAGPDQPTSYGLISYLFHTWLYMIGILSEDGELIDENSLELLDFDVKPAVVH